MNKHLGHAVIALAALSLSVPALAQTSPDEKGASQYAPGQTKERGQSAKEYAPGQAEGPAKQKAPGQQVKKRGSTGTSSGGGRRAEARRGTGSSSGSSGSSGSSDSR